ncbi:hypothetical protein D8674_021259 [Pyrus ussuriensis x Pyrus communis]|uniref:Uncharacterized protein n=1 Tax=Pyrus ussuriensis x Pyrus communis TaxID=2448454 RepID=A0A5N5GLE3_9ROSA|nr:hypothetical protein D8674_021259 [Pyrus ussuriensis x Pyrus communis]
MQYRLFEHQFHSSASEIESKAVSVIRAVFFVCTLDIDISKPALSFFPGAVEGQKVSIKFQIAATHYAAQLIANVASDLGLKIRSGGGLHGKAFYFFPWRSRVSWELMLARSEKKKETGGDGRDLHIHVFRSVFPFSDRFEIEFVKDGRWSPKEVDALVSTCVTWCEVIYIGI